MKLTKEKVLLISLALILIVRGFFIDWYRVPSDSMYPVLERGDYLAVNKLAYGFRFPFFKTTEKQWASPQRGDIILFFEPEDNAVLVKRVIGIGGDTVNVENGQVSLNGKIAQYVPVTGLINEPGIKQEGYREIWSESRSNYVLKTMEERTYHQGANNGRNAGKFVVPKGQLMLMGDNRDNSLDSRFIGMIPEHSVIGKVYISDIKDVKNK